MKRLYSEKPLPPRAQKADGSTRTKEYLTKVAMLVPAEILAGFLGFMTLASAVKNVDVEIVHWGIFLLCLLLTPFYFARQAHKTDPKIEHIMVSTAAFVVWVYATKGEILVPDYFDDALAGIALLAFSLVSGLIPMPEKENGENN